MSSDKEITAPSEAFRHKAEAIGREFLIWTMQVASLEELMVLSDFRARGNIVI